MKKGHRKSSTEALFGLMGAAFISGLLFALSAKIGVSPTGLWIANYLTVRFCSVASTVDKTGTVAYNCSNLLGAFATASLVITIVSIFIAVRSVGSIKIGLMLYAVFWAVGFLMIYVSI